MRDKVMRMICRAHPYESVRTLNNGNTEQGNVQAPCDSDREVGPHLKSLRLRCGLSIRQICEMANVTPGTISCIEHSKSSPSITTMRKILAALGSDFVSLWCRLPFHSI